MFEGISRIQMTTYPAILTAAAAGVDLAVGIADQASVLGTAAAILGVLCLPLLDLGKLEVGNIAAVRLGVEVVGVCVWSAAGRY